MRVNLPARFDHTFRVEVVIAAIVFGLVLLVFLAALIRSATARGRTASQKTGYKKTEAAYVSVVAVVAAALITFSLTQNTSPHPKPSLTVKVTGFQWCWRFAYQGTRVSVTANCVDGRLPTLVVPTGEPVRFDVTSADVVHSMWIPYLRYKLFAYPNYVNSFETTFARPGSWEGECAEFCGEYHYAMHFTLEAMTPAAFRSWLHSKEARAA
ncbi:MAG TPA: cytochrome c oxidase subunit II [Acidimicrobiales bacterium]|nr:cytochrome c oxidase subunit II [Acidimicrobiales bacterium]